jgi:UDP-N-acetylmuramate dehydrogenase
MAPLENISLALHTTFGIGGPARYFTEATNVAELREACDFARSRKVPLFVLGGGSNILVSDAGFPGLVIKNEIRGLTETIKGDSITIKVGAGESWDKFVGHCVEKGYWGPENLSLIPGSVGAAPVQNIGAYGREVKDIIESVSVFNSVTGEEERFSNEQCAFTYRDSVFKRETAKNLIITSVTFKVSLSSKPNISYKDLTEYFTLRRNVNPSIAEIRRAVIDIRTQKFPSLSVVGTAGSFWKNPIISAESFNKLKAIYPELPAHGTLAGTVKISLAWVLDNICKVKGYSKGTVRLFARQPLVLVAEKGSKASDVLAFAKEIEVLVKDKTGIDIEKEVCVLE